MYPRMKTIDDGARKTRPGPQDTTRTVLGWTGSGRDVEMWVGTHEKIKELLIVEMGLK